MKEPENLEEVISGLKELARAYREANENDYVQSGEYEGLRPDEIANRMVKFIETNCS